MKKILLLVSTLLFTSAAFAEKKVVCTLSGKIGNNPTKTGNATFSYKDCQKEKYNKIKRIEIDIFNTELRCNNGTVFIDTWYGNNSKHERVEWKLPNKADSYIFTPLSYNQNTLTYSCSVKKK